MLVTNELSTWPTTFCALPHQETKDPIHIMNIGISMEEEKDDSDLSEQFAVFCASKKKEFKEAGIRRITMVVFYKQQFPRYFTYR